MWQVSWENISTHSSFIQNLITPRTMPRSTEVILMNLRLERQAERPASLLHVSTSTLTVRDLPIYPAVSPSPPSSSPPQASVRGSLYISGHMFSLAGKCSPPFSHSGSPLKPQLRHCLSWSLQRVFIFLLFGLPGSRQPHPLLLVMSYHPFVTVPAWRLWRTEPDLRHTWISTWAQRLTQSLPLVYVELCW